ncbi:helix-turn-helix domain-containing protein [Sphingomonas yabuuchiae]|uniref:Helix-turn-helix transcriptional regulator n=1 Tax=Sphingomonas yabuuchiae TaxID=172044 RepID=A0AA41A0I6_9SPHN|nr:helix-turn-helix transcriptional regulator [Sphingomonas yabuuchiae]MBB4609613.1 transcriptional regulator with XRE-family HTH domain [Sphingomonas yabuuchiae]MBN3557926.1 helix-turn-helix transcriptional regulator [Sphingomonas yabuuchiae]
MIGERILLRLSALGKSQSWLARQVGITQPAINGLIRGTSRSSAHLHKIARALLTSPEYLTGEIDDPDENAAPPLPEPQFQPVTFEVMFPSQPALEQMFAGLLLASEGMSTDELAHELSVQLPKALALARSARPSHRAYQPVHREEDSEASHDARSAPLR